MPKFRLKADAVFEAKNIDDALLKLSSYFMSIATQGINAGQLFERGSVSVEKCSDEVV